MNILFITADQWRGECLSALGHAHVKTPNLDALANEGVLFRDHYAQATPCAPSRSSMHTGMYMQSNRCVVNGAPLDSRFTNWALEVKAAGYEPSLFGYTDSAIDPRGLDPEDPRLKHYSEPLPGIGLYTPMEDEVSTEWVEYLRAKDYPLPERPWSLYQDLRAGVDWAAGGDTVLPLAKAAAEKAIRLDPDLAEAHFALAFVHVLGWDWEAAEREFRKGSELNPSDSNGLTGFANFLSSMGQFEESVNIATRAVKVDPLSPFTHNELGSSLWFTGRTRAALAKYQEALQLDPEFFQTQWIIAGHHIISGDYDKAMPFLDKLKRDYESLSPVMIGQLGGNYARVGHRDDALEILNYLLKRSESEYMRASAVATVYLGLKEYDEALAWLEIAYEQRDILLIWLREEPLFDGLRSDARFQDLVARMNFPDTN